MKFTQERVRLAGQQRVFLCNVGYKREQVIRMELGQLDVECRKFGSKFTKFLESTVK